MANRHRIDELADLRAEVKLLKAREEALRSAILATPTNLSGDDTRRELCEITTERIDLEKLRREVGTIFLAQYMLPGRQVRVQLKPRTKKRGAA